MINETAPTVLVTVPRYLQKFASQVLLGIHNSSGLKRASACLAMRLARQHAQRRWDGERAFAREALYGVCRAGVFVPPQLRLQNGSLIFGADGLNSLLDSFDVDPLSEGPYPTNAQAIIDSGAFRSGIGMPIQTQLAALGQLAPPLNVSVRGAPASERG